MSNAETTLKLLEELRRRWAEKFAGEIAENGASLLNARLDVGDLFAENAQLTAMAGQLVELQALISAIEQATQSTLPPGSDGPRSVDPISLFSPFISLVRENRLVEATQELARIFPMPVDQLATATDCFSRAVNSHPGLADRLEGLCRNLDTLSDPDAARILIQTLGFQVIEAQIAVNTLRSTIPSKPDVKMSPPKGAFTAKKRFQRMATRTNELTTADKP